MRFCKLSLSRQLLITTIVAVFNYAAQISIVGAFQAQPVLSRRHRSSPSATLHSKIDDSETKSSTNPGSLWPSLQRSLPTANGDDDDDEDEEYDDELSQVLDSILKIHATHSEPDHLMPWQRTHQSTSTSSGFVIEIPNVGFRVMTNAHSVEYGSIIRVQRRGDETKYQAKVDVIANECDLAILSVDNDKFWQDRRPLQFGPLPSLQDEVEVLGYPTGGDSLSVTCGVVSRIEMQEYAQSGSHLLAIQIDAAINAGNSGGPVVNDELQVVGVAFQALDDAENIGYVVPITIVQHVLEDIRRNNGRYTGFCSLGVKLSLLENRAFRKSLQMTEGVDSGVMIQAINPTTIAAKESLLRPRDVVMSVDGIPIANDGKIPFRRGERVSLICYIQTKFFGDSVCLTVLRDGKKLSNVHVPVSLANKLVRAHWSDKPPPYIVVGGLVFTALSVPYLEAVHAWESYVSSKISHLVGLEADASLEQEGDEVVVLAQVLAHPENLGYDMYSDLHLTTFNGQKVRSLRHLLQLVDAFQAQLSEADGLNLFARFEFAPSGHIVVMEGASLERITKEVCEEHSIQRPHVIHDDIGKRMEGGI